MSETEVINQALSDAYDETPYQSNAFSISAPGHLRAVAALYGLDTPAVENASILELGCAAGGNLLPIAMANPQAKVVGIDLSGQQIDAGRKVIDALGVPNLELLAMSILDITPSLGKFDYIIVHGVFSWVPPEVRTAILRVCRQNLSPDGIAYISYNTYPGWKASDVVRDAMILNSYGATTAQERLERAKDILGMLEHGLAAGNPMASALQFAARQLRGQSDYYLMHEHLEAVNSPCYFLEFVAAIEEHGLTYLTDAEPQTTMSSNFGENVAALHGALAANVGREMREQYLDFAVGRQFRKSLVVHSNKASLMRERPEANAFERMYFASQLTQQKSDIGSSGQQRQYVSSSGVGIASTDPTFFAIADALRSAWPRALSYSELLECARAKSKGVVTENRLSELILHHLVTLLNANALIYRIERVAYETQLRKPEWIPGLSELLALAHETTLPVGLYNLWHQNARLPEHEAARLIMRHIDGAKSVTDLRTLVRNALAEGRLEHPSGKSLRGVRNLEPVAQTIVTEVLNGLRTQGLVH